MSVGKYGLKDFGKMLTSVRIEPYQSAINSVVKPGDVVVDLGAGTGVLTLIASRAGASRVYAIDPVPEVNLVPDLVKANRLTTEVIPCQKLSFDIELPEKADLVVSSIHGVVPLFKSYVRSVIDARKRFLKPDGEMIPQSDQIWAALVHCKNSYSSVVMPWNDEPYGFDMSLITRHALNRLWPLQPDVKTKLLTNSVVFCTLNHREIESESAVSKLEFECSDDGVIHGVCLWNDCTLFSEISISNHLGIDRTGYGRGFLPFEKPLSVLKGDLFEVELSANPFEGNYLWKWNTSLFDRDTGEAKARFFQNSLKGEIVTRRDLANY